MAEFPTYEEMAKRVAEKALDEFLYQGKSIREWMKIIAEQEPKTGHWKRIGYDIYECSICGQDVMTGDICAYRHCHCCGAKMIEPQESEGKE